MTQTDLLILMKVNCEAATVALADRAIYESLAPRIELAGGDVLARINGSVPSQSGQIAAARHEADKRATAAIHTALHFAQKLAATLQPPEPKEAG